MDTKMIIDQKQVMITNELTKWEWERTLAVGNKALSWNKVSAQ